MESRSLKRYFPYLALLVIFGFGIWLILATGSRLYSERVIPASSVSSPSMLMARWTGMNWRDAFSLGALMNTRGLVELIVLSIGYDLGILSARSFAMLVLMALVTTFMTGPLLSLVRNRES